MAVSVTRNAASKDVPVKTFRESLEMVRTRAKHAGISIFTIAGTTSFQHVRDVAAWTS